ncbi:hypothetical protein SK128_021870 [Halocaridina rubra]|uniref:Uncharacterized protein n=1 Tax=Halocaridina rubra TaxID=373956 RepID=A0AAN8WKA3_HALRR
MVDAEEVVAECSPICSSSSPTTIPLQQQQPPQPHILNHPHHSHPHANNNDNNMHPQHQSPQNTPPQPIPLEDEEKPLIMHSQHLNQPPPQPISLEEEDKPLLMHSQHLNPPPQPLSLEGEEMVMGGNDVERISPSQVTPVSSDITLSSSPDTQSSGPDSVVLMAIHQLKQYETRRGAHAAKCDRPTDSVHLTHFPCTLATPQLLW